MQYIGGKQKSGGHKIAAIVAQAARIAGTRRVIEPFCGGLSVTYRLCRLGLEVAPSDACEALITLYREVQSGWAPPEVVSRETWDKYKACPDPSDPMTAFCGFGCSRSGAWFSSFVVDYKYTKRRVPAATAARDSLAKKLRDCAGVQFVARDYSKAPLDGVVYCDIPYKDTMGYPAVGSFRHLMFWGWAEYASQSTPVLVSERQAPDSFVCVAEWSLQSRITTDSGKRRFERVFAHPKWARDLQAPR